MVHIHIYVYSNHGTQFGAQNKDFGAVSETDLTKGLGLSG